MRHVAQRYRGEQQRNEDTSPQNKVSFIAGCRDWNNNTRRRSMSPDLVQRK